MTDRDRARIENIERLADRAYEVHLQAILAYLPRHGRHTSPEERKAISGAHNLLGSLSAIRSQARALQGERA